MKIMFKGAVLASAVILGACSGVWSPTAEAQGVASTEGKARHSGEVIVFKGEVWADNWFQFYLGEQLIATDSVPITTERSFNAETFTFSGSYPLELNFIIKDFKEDDSGLEYIGTPRQQIGDGGFIAQFTDTRTGKVAAVSNSGWRCKVIHKAPLNKGCVKDANPIKTCGFTKLDEPTGWKSKGFDTTDWEHASEYSKAEVGVKDGYNTIRWSDNAKLIWGSDLKADNTLLCKTLVVEK